MIASHAALQDTHPEAYVALDELLGNRFSTGHAICQQHGKDEGHLAGVPPQGVAFVTSTEEVAACIAICARHGIPAIPFGTGTALEGGVAALRGGVCLDVSRMSRVLQVNAEDLDVTVEAGLTRNQLNEHLRHTGLFFPIDPGADASIGGMTATRASGTNAVRYGTMRDNVLALTVVLADGRIIKTSRRARKSSAGYDLTRLFVGSEGTLGVITEITLRVYGMPEAMSSAICCFSDLKAAVDCVIETIQLGVPVARIELLDEAQVDAVNRHSGLSLTVAPTLLLEFHGSEAAVREQAETVGELAAEHGGSQFEWALRSEDRNRLWQARHDAAYACKALKPGADIWPTDVCVPISRLAECIEETRRDLDESRLIGPIVGHVGDGNFHVVLVVDTKDADEAARARAFNDRLVERALAMEGTCTGEHGIGHGKLDFLVAEHGEAVSVMRDIKRALDPDNIMNPGKIVRM